MAVFEVEGPDGRVYEVDAPDMQTAAAALASVSGGVGGVSTDTEATGEFSDRARALATGAANGASLGFGDNIAAAIGGVGSMARGDGFRRGYDESLDIVREGMARDSSENPGLYAAGNIGGAMVPAIASAPYATGQSLLGTIGRGAAIGSVEGAVTGAGNADGENIAQSAGFGGILGGFLGAAAPVAVAGASKAYRAAANPVSGAVDLATGRPNQAKANRALVNALRKSGKSDDDIARMLRRAAAEGQPDYRMVDALGQPGRRVANGIVRGGDGEAATEIANFLDARQMGQADRVSGFVDDAFGLEGRTANQYFDALEGARDATAKVNYNAARKGAAPVNVNSITDAIDDVLRSNPSIDGGVTGLRETSMGARLSAIKKQIATDDFQSISFDQVLETKQELGRVMEAIKRKGKVPPQISRVYGELDAALEASSPAYRSANDSFREASRNMDAVDTGRNMSRPARRAGDTVPEFEGMPSSQQRGARIGYGDDLLTKLEANPAPTANKAKPLQSPKRNAEAGAMAVDPDLYARRLARENDMWNTQNTVLRGSQTANNQQDIADAASSAGGLLRAARSGANFQIGDAVDQIAKVIGPVAKGETEATRQLIAKALLSNDPMAVLAPAIKQDKSAQMRRRVIEAILRNATRDALN